MEHVIALTGVIAADERLPKSALDLELAPGEFALIEVPGRRQAETFADLCAGLVPLVRGAVRMLGRDWTTLEAEQADALRGRIGRLFSRPFRADTPDVAARVLLGRLHHTRIPERALQAEAAALAVRFGLPGLPAGPARMLSDGDLLRAACVRAFLGQPRLIILELPLSAQENDILSACLSLGAQARGGGAAVIWLAAAGPALRHRALAQLRLRLSDARLDASSSTRKAA